MVGFLHFPDSSYHFVQVSSFRNFAFFKHVVFAYVFVSFTVQKLFGVHSESNNSKYVLLLSPIVWRILDATLPNSREYLCDIVAHYFSVTPFWECTEWLSIQEFTCASCTAVTGSINNTQVLYWYEFGAILIPIFSEHHLLIVSLCQEAVQSLRSLSEYLHIWKQETAVLTQPRVLCSQDVTSHPSPSSCMLWQWGRNF